ncbi:MAG: hypothetical protein HY426_02695, partial [Candidatus Levybacteria bacterium]|nr:hypothetical protein [Candidatus Levybacteria bacterium]
MNHEIQPIRQLPPEAGRQAKPIQLTRPVINPTLGSEGNIFMPDATSAIRVENLPKPTTPAGPRSMIPSAQGGQGGPMPGESLPPAIQERPRAGAKAVPQERIDAARAAWDVFSRGRELSLDERRTQQMLIERGLKPMAGGADRLNSLDYPDPLLNNIVTEVNTEVNRVGVGNPLDATFIDRQIKRVQGLFDNGRVDSVQASRLIGKLNDWMAEAMATRQERYGRYFSEEEERAILGDDSERERVFEEIFVGVDAQPGVQFDRGMSLEAHGKIDQFFTILNHAKVKVRDPVTGEEIDITGSPDPARQAEVSKQRLKLAAEYSGRRQIRQTLHDANWSVSEGGGDINAFGQAVSTFKAEHVDLIFADPLVSTALHMFEQAFQQIKADNQGMLPYEEVAWNYKTGSSKLEDKVWELMREHLRASGDDVREWRLRRAIILARGFGVASLRFPEIAASAKLPKAGPMSSSTERSGRLASIYGEAIARYLDPFEHIVEKFNIGEEDRAFLYFFLTGEKARFQSREHLQMALDMASNLTGGDKRLIDIVNIFRTGGGFSQSTWRAFLVQKGFSEEQMRRSGLGLNETRVSGDVDDQIRAEVRAEFTGRSEEEMEKEARRRIKDKKIKGDKERDRRLSLWKDALKTNPLRVMWQWEEREPGQRVRFLAQALEISENEAKALLPQVETDLMLIQEDTVQRLGRGAVSYADPEMLNYSLIGGATPTPEEITRRSNVERYVAKIRDKAREPNNQGEDHGFIRSLFEMTPVERTPFPFVIGFEDIPFSDLNFINTGGRGFARRINDFAASVRATNEMTNLITAVPKTHNIEPLIESLLKVKEAVAEYD